VEKVIFLVDMNAFFISCETTRNHDLMGKPAAVAGDPQKRSGIILAANYEARKFGVRTAMVVHEALKLCPGMLLVPPDHSFYQYKSHEVMKLFSNYTPVVQQNSIDEAWLDMTGTEALFGTPLDAAAKIMEDIKVNLGLWCSIGISENKFLSKMAADMKKPLGITELWKRDIKEKLWPMPIGAMYGVGAKSSEKFNHLGIKTIGELANLEKNYLYKNFGKFGIDLHQHANGIDYSSVEVNSPDDIKSIGHSTTLPEDVKDIERLKHVLMQLSEEVGIRARKHNKKGHCIQITLKFSDFEVITRQTTIKPTFFTKNIYEAGCELLQRNFRPSKAVRLIGITLKGFEDNCFSQQISFFNHKEKDNKHEKVDMVMDKIRNKYGNNKIGRASLIRNKKN
jgi:DNA polymerase-4